ncbi:MAG TPA: SDR family oxidoreductase, partial [Bryobacteraceae bacterium]|nr:SDR family oxidoreductase [Bryobacteraceae bacterium]
VRGPLFASQAAAAAMKDGGNIINIGSMASLKPFPGGAVYSPSKAALDAMSRVLAVELAPRKIRVNAVLPGPVETEGTHAMDDWEQFKTMLLPRTPLGRIGEPRDIAKVVSFLASEDAGWMTGQIVEAAGGFN